MSGSSHLAGERRWIAAIRSRSYLEAADRRRPPLHFVGAHPLAGNERSGLDGVLPDLFEEAAFPLCPGRHATRQDVATARKLVRRLGGRPFLVDPEVHDRARVP